jgi:15-cis-phytoene synthase
MAEPLLDELPGPQRLALAYAPAAARPATLALLALDARLGAVLRRGGEPVLAQIRFAWWRDRLAAEPESWPAGDAVLGLLRDWRRPAALGPLVDGWEGLLGESLDAAAIGAFAEGRGEAFAELAREFGSEPAPAADCGRLWALGDLAANMSGADERAAAVAAAALLPRCPPLPRALRPLAVLAGLARRSLARGGGPLLEGPRALALAVRLGIAGR